MHFDPTEAVLFGLDPLEYAQACMGIGYLVDPLQSELMGYAFEPDMMGFSLGKIAKGIGKGVSGAVKGTVKTVASGAKQVVSTAKAVAKPIIKNPLMAVVPGIPALVGKGPMFDLGAKLHPGVSSLHQAGKGNVMPAVGAGAAFVVPANAKPAEVAKQAAKLVAGTLNPALRNAAQNVVKRTVSLAATGNASAVRAVAAVAKASVAKVATAKPVAKAAAKPAAAARAKVVRGSGTVAYRVQQPAGSKRPGWAVQKTGRVLRA